MMERTSNGESSGRKVREVAALRGFSGSFALERRAQVRIPVMWAGNSGDVGRRRSEATLVAFYSSQVAHMSQEKRKFSVH
jgi:hypothetical protein